MISSRFTGRLTAALLLCIFCPTTALASGPRIEISHLIIKNSGDTLQVDLKIDSEFTAELNEAVMSGVPIRFIFSISLYAVEDFWFDTRVASQTAIHELRYDVNRRVYKLTRSRGLLRPIYIEDYEKARLLISEISNLEVISLKELSRGEHYQLLVAAGLSVRKYAFFNLFREVKNDHYAINFIY